MRIARTIVVFGSCALALCSGRAWGQDAPASPQPSEKAADSSQSNGTRIPGSVISGYILTHVTPVYPKKAKKKHISGMVVLRAVIGKDGLISHLTVVSGPEELRESALDAVKQWTYEPYRLNGEPTEVDTTITVNYNMGPAAAAKPVNGSTTLNGLEVVELKENAKELRGVTKVPPHYPGEAKQAHVTGDVVLSVLIGLDGHVETATAVSGPDPLRDAALEAVRQWVYPPFAVNGVAERVHTTVTIHFRMS